jgi:hypothetical protein
MTSTLWSLGPKLASNMVPEGNVIDIQNEYIKTEKYSSELDHYND